MPRRPLQRALLIVPVVLFVVTGPLRGETPSPLTPLEFLLGQWEGVGDQAGATGGFAFTASVQGRVIVRTNYSNTAAANGQPASRHDDLMVIYVEAGLVKADYFDNEGHVIRYIVQGRDREVTFLSEITPSLPRYRLTYTRASATTLNGRFEIAPPGQPESFAPYFSWTARRGR